VGCRRKRKVGFLREGGKVVVEMESGLKRVNHKYQKNPPLFFSPPVLEREKEFACQGIITPWEKLQFYEEV